ncbi:MAG: sel1 repeat family protein [Deltaproteobacteria bacterium]|jgi:TPR repeat protein|nr:sel1 repeat family protein [Deltaproteobacteria bacterium]
MVPFVELLERAENGEARAQYELGLAYSSGRQVVQDLEEAVNWWRQAFEQGLEEPIYELAQAYGQGGPGLERDLAESFYWWLQAAKWGRLEAATQACWRVGQAYANGVGVAQDFDQARRWLAKASEQGLAEAEAFLSQLVP